MSRDPKRNPALRHAEQYDGGIQNPDAWAEYLEQGEEKEVRTWRRVLEEIEVGEFASEHTLGVHPEIDLIVALQDRRARQKKEVAVQEDGDGHEQRSRQKRLRRWAAHEFGGRLRWSLIS